MKEERMMILTMLEEGKISSEEALKLLDAIDDIPDEISEKLIITEEEIGEKKVNIEKTMDKVEKTLKEKGKKVSGFGVDIGNKISGLFDSMKDKGSTISFWGNYDTVTTTLEKDISHIEKPILDLKSVNGGISLKPWDKDSLLIKVNCNFKKGVLDENDTFYDFYEEDNKIVFKPIFTSNVGIKLDVFVPYKKYDNITLNTSNAKIEIENITLDSLICDTTNSNINITNIDGKDIKLSTKNGKIFMEKINSSIVLANSTNSNILLNEVSGEKVFVTTKNGKIYMNELVASDIDGVTSNGSIEIQFIQGVNIRLNTSNGKIICKDILPEKIENLNLVTSNASIYTHFGEVKGQLYFDLETSLGTINLEIPNLVYKINQQNKLGTRKIIAHNINYSEEDNSFKLLASTSNASIKIDEED